ncbi:MAG: nitroreductase family protein [Azonexaceae bacterium]|nr:nitroreductase family protein [Azonexaceae bacterium]
MQGVIEAKIIKAYHRVEKGLSLADPRPGFGKDAVQTVLDGVEQYVQRFGQNHTTHRALNTLKEYVRFNSANNADVAWVEARLQRLGNSIGSENAGGTRRVTRDEIAAAANIDLKDFFNSRYSIRQFTSQAVDDDLLTQAVQMAKKTPSVCNRESGCVFVVSDQEQKARLLSLQNGNRGFGDQADRVLVITSRLDAFLTVGERYQCWIDGGLFAMSLIYALHSLGLGSCCLNWSVEPEADQAMKQLPGIPKGHAIIMLLAVGHIPAELLVAQSPRRPLNEVLNFI